MSVKIKNRISGLVGTHPPGAWTAFKGSLNAMVIVTVEFATWKRFRRFRELDAVNPARFVCTTGTRWLSADRPEQFAEQLTTMWKTASFPDSGAAASAFESLRVAK